MNKDIKDIYNEILNDKEIKDQYQKVENAETARGGWAFHNFLHIQNVTTTAEQILTELGFDENFIYATKIACLLHDIGAVESKENHAHRSYEYAKKYFNDHNINFKNIDLVLDAIKIHSDGFDTDNIIALTLIIADKLDIKKNRTSEVGKTIIGHRQYTHINDITLTINANLLEVNFLTDGNINMNEINEYYFTKKVFKAIKSFAQKLKLDYKILLDNQEWIIEDNQK